MPFNGSGVWAWNYNWANDAANGIPITASRMDAQFDDAGNNGFDNCITRDGQGSASADTPWNGFKITGLGLATTLGDVLSYGRNATVAALVATTVNGNTFTTGTGTLTIAAGKTLTASNTLTFTGTNGSSVDFGAGGTVSYTSGSVASITGTANQINATASTGAITLSLSSTLVAPGTLQVTTTSNLRGRSVFGTNSPTSDVASILLASAQTNVLASGGAHGVRDESTYIPASSGGYANFDAGGSMSGAASNHLIAFQSRNTFAGANTLSFAIGGTHLLNHTGTGHVQNSIGHYMYDAIGTGPIDLQAAVWCDSLTRGSSNYCIYSAGTSTPSYHGGPFQLGGALTYGGVTATNAVTGTGPLVLGTSPSFTTPLLGTPTSGTLTNCTGLPVGSGISGLASGIATFLATPSSANLIAAMTDETGTGACVFATSPTLVTPLLGTPTSGTLTNCTGLPISTGVSGLAANIATFLATPSSANLAAALTDETGTGAAVFASSPALTGTPTITNNQNAGSLPLLSNNSAGTSAYAGYQVSNGTSAGSLYQIGTGNTFGGVFRQNGTMLQANGAGGLTIATSVNQPIYFAVNNTDVFQLNGTGLIIASGQVLKLGNAYVATPQVGTGYVTMQDSTGTTYKFLVAA